MANIVRPAATHTDTSPIEKHTNTPTPGIATSLSPTTIGLICGLGGCGILGFFIWAIVYFRWFKPIEIRIKEGEAGYYNTPTAEQNKNKNRNSTITDVTQGIFAHNAIGISTERPATDGGVYPSIGMAVNTALEREILEILEAETVALRRTFAKLSGFAATFMSANGKSKICEREQLAQGSHRKGLLEKLYS
ncbi:unnamed protein product [Alternaria alternata]